MPKVTFDRLALSGYLLMFSAIFPASGTRLTVRFTLVIEREAKLGDQVHQFS